MQETGDLATTSGQIQDVWVVGAAVRFVVVGEPNGSDVPVRLLGDDEAHDAILVIRRGDPPPVGAELDGWILDAGGTAQVTTDEFGRLPVSDGMRPRYQAAVAAGLALVSEATLTEGTAESLSELKGMFNRIVRRDQRDWASVSAAFGHPPRAAAASWAQQISTVRAAIAAGDAPETSTLCADRPFRMALKRAEAALSGRSWGGHRRELTSSEGQIVRESRHPKQGAETEKLKGVVPDTSLAAGVALLRRAETQAKLERANRVHEKTRLALANALADRGFEPHEDQLIDLFCELPTGLAIYEVKSIAASNWRSQIRKGVAQLKEYRFLYGRTDSATLYLVMSEPLDEGWVLDLLVAEYQIGVLWRATDGFAGPAARAALGGSPR